MKEYVLCYQRAEGLRGSKPYVARVVQRVGHQRYLLETDGVQYKALIAACTDPMTKNAAQKRRKEMNDARSKTD